MDALANPYRVLGQASLVSTIRQTGTEVLMDPQRCYTHGIMGYYSTMRDARGEYLIDEMGLCVENHKGDYKELGNTLRHEAVHVAQECNGGPMLSVQELMPYASRRTLSALEAYPAEHYHVELEAWTMAEMASNDDIEELLIAACSN